MKNVFRRKKASAVVALLLLLAIVTGSASVVAEDVNWALYNERAEAFVTATASGDFDVAADMLDETMTEAAGGASGLQAVWADITGQAGAFVAIYEIENTFTQGYFLCDVASWHENAGVTLRVVFSEDGLIAGLSTLAITELPGEGEGGGASAIPAETRREGFTDYAVIVGEHTDFPLSGILSMPDNAAGKVPAVVLVHGSGANDMDTTIFTNKPFRDIADYLAANGIAVIRYDKRPFAHGATMDMNGLTVREETMEDAIFATEMLKADPRIDENRVFILGHSLGGMLAPRIHAEGGDYAGLILFAASPRFLLDVSKAQNYAAIEAMEDGEDKEAALAFMEEWDAYYNAFLTLPDEEAKMTPIPGWGGVTAIYFKDLYENPVSVHIESATVPFLVIQGSNDLQTTADVDFVLYQELLAGRANATLNLYEGLNHLLMPSTAKSIAELMDEYAIESRVDSQVLADIVEWIKGQ